MPLIELNLNLRLFPLFIGLLCIRNLFHHLTHSLFFHSTVIQFTLRKNNNKNNNNKILTKNKCTHAHLIWICPVTPADQSDNLTRWGNPNIHIDVWKSAGRGKATVLTN